MNTALALAGMSGVCWTIVYIECIRLGFKHKTYAMPFWALALNIAWEALHSYFGYRGESISLQVVFNAVWCVFDIGILYTYFKYGRKYFPDFIPAGVFVPWSLLALAASFVIQYFFIVEFGMVRGGAYAAFLQNLAMSILFIGMFIQRRGSEGQSLTLAICKFVGTLCPTILVGIVGLPAFGQPNAFILVLGVLIALFDLIYIFMLIPKQNAHA